VALHRFAIDDELGPEHLGDLARTVERALSIDLVNPMLDGNFFQRRRLTLVIQPGPIESQQLTLRLEREFRRVAFD
jgi:hypothetical protein